MVDATIGLAFGYGISDNVADAYQFLMRNFKEGDSIYVFGFSRGAYTARALCGMLHIIGLLREDNEGLIPYAIRMIKNKKINFGIAFDFKNTFSRNCKPHFIGAWDTVSSLGWVYDAVHFPYTTTTNPDFQMIRHAVSIYEHRAFFRQNLFGKPHSPTQDVKEVWFSGVHSDVGGSYPESESQLSKIALRWMLCEAELAGLKVDQVRKAEVLGGKLPNVAPDPLTKNIHESLNGAWWIAEFWPKTVSIHVDKNVWRTSMRLNLARHRTIEPNSLIHESVEKRLADSSLGYNPRNLPQPQDRLRVSAIVVQRKLPRLNFRSRSEGNCRFAAISLFRFCWRPLDRRSLSRQS